MQFHKHDLRHHFLPELQEPVRRHIEEQFEEKDDGERDVKSVKHARVMLVEFYLQLNY